MKKVLRGILVGLLAIILMATPALAISNPDTISFGSGSSSTYRIYYDLVATGDWLIIAEGLVYYAVTPTDYTSDEAYLFELLNGSTVVIAKPLPAYGDRPVGIYLSPSQVTTLGLTVGGNYTIRIHGSPMIFASPTGNSINATLAAGDYYSNNLGVVGVDGFTSLRNFVINTMAKNMETYDGVTTYRQTLSGIKYLSTTGASLFLAGIPNLDTIDSTIFAVYTQTLQNPAPAAPGTYSQSITPSAVLGTTTANGFSAIGAWVGVGAANGAPLVAVVLMIVVGVVVSKKTESPLAVLAALVAAPFVAGLNGMMGTNGLAMPMVIGITVVIIGTMLLFSRINI